MSDIKIFRLNGDKVDEIAGTTMQLERPLQTLFEQNLGDLLGVKFLGSEYSTTDGRIDTIGLDENNYPVIIEYKRSANENIINQGLFYMDWLMDHKGTFELLVQNNIDKDTADKIEWGFPRLLCVAGDFTRYDIHAVKQMNRNIELIRYRKFGDDLLMLDLLTSTISPRSNSTASNTQQFPQQYKEHRATIAEATGEQRVRFESLTNFCKSLGDDVQERQLKVYTAFKRIKNFACVELRNQENKILIYVKLDPDKEEIIPGFTRDMRDIGHYGTGNLEIVISSDENLERAKPLIEKSYEVS